MITCKFIVLLIVAQMRFLVVPKEEDKHCIGNAYRIHLSSWGHCSGVRVTAESQQNWIHEDLREEECFHCTFTGDTIGYHPISSPIISHYYQIYYHPVLVTINHFYYPLLLTIISHYKPSMCLQRSHPGMTGSDHTALTPPGFGVSHAPHCELHSLLRHRSPGVLGSQVPNASVIEVCYTVRCVTGVCYTVRWRCFLIDL